MLIKRKLKNGYKKMLVKIGRSSVGKKIENFVYGTAEILCESRGIENREIIAERLMVERLIEEDDNSNDKSQDQIELPPNANNKNIKKASEYSNKEYAFSRGINEKKIKIRFAHCNPATLNAFETVADSFLADTKYNVKVILMQESGNSLEMSRQMKMKGYRYIYNSDYDIAEDQPDIIVFYQLEYVYTDALYDAHKFAGMVVLIPLTLTTIWYGERSVSRMHFDKFKPGLVFATDLVMDSMHKYVPEVHTLKMVPPQIDTIYRKFKEMDIKSKYPDGWEKLKGKKVFFYMTDHGLRHYSVSNEVSLDLYIRTLFEYAQSLENAEVGLIIRPHFALIQELISHYWSVKDYLSLVEYCKKSPNIVWDETNDFIYGLSVCDAVLSDPNTSVTYFSIAAEKPIAAVLRYDMPVDIYNPDFLDGLYRIQSQENLIKFMDMMKAGKDPKMDKRQKLYNRLISPFDGHNGERIKADIDKIYRKLHVEEVNNN